MLKPLYTIQQFSEKVSQINTLKELVALFQEPTIELSITASAMQLSWNAKEDIITSGGKLIFYPTLNINGKLYEPSIGQEVVIRSLCGLEVAFLETLKGTIRAVVK